MKATLVLENGSSFEGLSIGAPAEKIGEVVLNTAVVGYQEMITDPTNAGKILILTYPLIGNYGVAKKFYESEKSWIAGLVIKEESRMYSNWQAEGSFSDFLKKEGVLAISDVDTRTLAVEIRDKGEMLGIISTEEFDKNILVNKLNKYKEALKKDFISKISVKKITKIDCPAGGPNIAVLDLGMSNSFIKQLKCLNCSVTLMPYNTPSEKILAEKFDGLVVSNGPEDDAALPQAANTVKELLGRIPILGISTGHEVIGIALGGRLKRLKVGHHGVNYPVKADDSFKGEITVQNHSFVVDEDSIKNIKGVKISLRNINDNSIEEMESKKLKFISTQYYPASPGFNEVNETFRRFFNMIPHKKGMKQKQSSKACGEVQYAKA